MDYLAHEPEIGLLALAEASYALEEVEVDTVGGVEADAVNVEGLYPVIHSVDEVVAHTGIAEIELDQIVVTVPALVPERVAAGAWTAEVEVLEPVAVLRALTLFLYINELREFSSDVVENSVKDNAYTVFVKSVTNEAERVIVTESAVYLLVVDGVVAVLYGFKNGTEINGVHVHLLEMRYPVEDLVKTVCHILASVIEFGCSAESQRIDVIDYRVIVPIHNNTLLIFICLSLQGNMTPPYQPRSVPARADTFPAPFRWYLFPRYRHMKSPCGSVLRMLPHG